MKLFSWRKIKENFIKDFPKNYFKIICSLLIFLIIVDSANNQIKIHDGFWGILPDLICFPFIVIYVFYFVWRK